MLAANISCTGHCQLLADDADKSLGEAFSRDDGRLGALAALLY